jgi:hypothetical protein
MVVGMPKLTFISIVLSSLSLMATPTSGVNAASDAEHTPSVWSSRDGALQFGRASADPDVETSGKPSSPTTDVDPLSQNALICEPSR